MPNGRHYTEQEWRDLTSFFETISEPLNQFATKYGLIIDKYYHDCPEWTFRFAHPSGGSCSIQVMRTKNHSVWIGLVWYKDDYDSFTRSSKHDVWKGVSVEPKDLSNSLEKALQVILGWRLGEWTDVAGGYRYPWGQYTKQEWEAMNPKYPLPKMGSGS
jgi:hypothetical protein